MPISIYTNVSSLDAQKHLGQTQAAVQRNMAHLASGLRIATAADDAAGLGISTQFDADVRSFSQGVRNANDGISFLQTTEGALGQIHGILERMRELAVESSNGTYGTVDRQNMVVEVQQLQSEIDRISRSTFFGNIQVLNGASTVTLQVGINNTADDQISMNLSAAGSTALSVDSTAVKLDTQSGAQSSLSKIDAAITAVSAQRANIGALQNRVQIASSNDSTFGQNLSAATSRIRDVDVASESAELARNQVLTQAGVAVLSQANQAPQLALSLLKG